MGENATVVRTHGELAVIHAGATVGPFSYLRPGTVLGADGKIGAFVETKNAIIGEHSKVPHLSYVGDATIGEYSNIGAATIFVNYDGVGKARTEVGEPRAHRVGQHADRARHDRRRRVHGGRRHHPQGRSAGRDVAQLGAAANRGGLGRAHAGPESADAARGTQAGRAGIADAATDIASQDSASKGEA